MHGRPCVAALFMNSLVVGINSAAIIYYVVMSLYNRPCVLDSVSRWVCVPDWSSESSHKIPTDHMTQAWEGDRY